MLIFITLLLQTRVCISGLTIYHIINISPSVQYLYSCSCKSFRHNPGLLDLLCHVEKKKEDRGPGSRDDLVTQPSSQDTAINYDINFSVAIVSLHDSYISHLSPITKQAGASRHITCHFSFVFLKHPCAHPSAITWISKEKYLDLFCVCS